MSNGPHGKPGRRIKGARGFKVKVFDVLHKETYWYGKTYSSLRNVKLAIAQGGFNERQFLVRGEWNAETLGVDYRMCVELFIYDVETWTLVAVRKGNGGTDIGVLTDRCPNCTMEDYSRSYWSSRAGEWEDNVKTQEEQDDE